MKDRFIQLTSYYGMIAINTDNIAMLEPNRRDGEIGTIIEMNFNIGEVARKYVVKEEYGTIMTLLDNIN